MAQPKTLAPKDFVSAVEAAVKASTAKSGIKKPPIIVGFVSPDDAEDPALAVMAKDIAAEFSLKTKIKVKGIVLPGKGGTVVGFRPPALVLKKAIG